MFDKILVIQRGSIEGKEIQYAVARASVGREDLQTDLAVTVMFNTINALGAKHTAEIVGIVILRERGGR